MDFNSGGSLTVDNSAHLSSKDIRSRYRHGQYHDMLLDDVLLKIFDFYVDKGVGKYFLSSKGKQKTERWITLAHVCRRWRRVVFRSPRRLNLRLVCTHTTPARDILDVWPPLPLIISNVNCIRYESSVDNTIAALEHNDRVSQIKLGRYTKSQFEDFMDSAPMLKPFPELTVLRFVYCHGGGVEPESQSENFPIPSWVEPHHWHSISGNTKTTYPFGRSTPRPYLPFPR